MLRATILLSLTAAPFLAVVVLTVFGKQARGWLIKRIGLSTLIHALGFAAYMAIVFLLAMCVLVVMYRFGRPGERSYREVLPGALVATVLWWAADISFGFYVRKMPYDAGLRRPGRCDWLASMDVLDRDRCVGGGSV